MSTNLISAYFAICFPSFTYYVKTLSCTIGRRSIPNSSGAVDAVPVHVDIDLGPLKSVSRLHARIEYDDESESFVICILGRNGAWVDGVWAKSGSVVPLTTRTTIQIATRTFQFLLATPTQQQAPPESHTERSPSPSDVVDVNILDSDPPDSPHVPLMSSELPIPTPVVQPPDTPLSTLCCRAIEASGGKATLGQIRRWLVQEEEWYKVNDGWQASIRNLISTDPLFYKLRREKSQKGKDPYYAFRTPGSATTSTGAASSKPAKPSIPKGRGKGASAVAALQESFDGGDSAELGGGYVDVEGDVIDVDGIDDPPPLPVPTPLSRKRPAASTSTSTSRPPAKKPKISSTTKGSTAQKVPRKSLLASASASSAPAASTSSNNTPTLPNTPPAPTTTPEERRLARRRLELDTKITAALAARSAPTLAAETAGRAVCIPIRIDTSPPTPPPTNTTNGSTPTPTAPQPLSLHRGEILLSPSIFAHISDTQLAQLRKLETPTVLEILRAELKRSLMEEYRAKKGKSGGKPASSRGPAPTSSGSAAGPKGAGKPLSGLGRGKSPATPTSGLGRGKGIGAAGGHS